MPIYEYECSACHHQFDLRQKISEAPVKQCPHCSQDTVVRLVSAAGFQLKGSGWYATDFKNKGKPPEPSKTTSSDSSGGEASDASTASSSKTSDTKGETD